MMAGTLYVIVVGVCLSAVGAKIISWPWLFPLREWGSLTMTFLGKFGYI